MLGSVATGTARDDSDIDVALFMCPLERYIVPAESIWRPDDDTFHSIVSEDITAGPDDLQLDIHRYDLSLWRSPGHEWPEPTRAELATGWIAFDRDGEVPTLVAEHVTYDDGHRLHQLDEALVWLDQHLDRDKLVQRWETLEAVVAHDRLQAAYEYLVQAFVRLQRTMAAVAQPRDRSVAVLGVASLSQPRGPGGRCDLHWPRPLGLRHPIGRAPETHGQAHATAAG